MPTVVRHALFLLCFNLAAIYSTAQTPVFSPASEDQAMLKKLTDKFEEQHKKILSSVPSKYRNDYRDIYTLRWENIKTVLDKRQIYLATPARKYMEELVGIIVKGNPQLQNYPLNCYFSRTDIPNASYVGQGIILFNMGLFERLENESQVAFVLCHEIAHYVLQHSEHAIESYVQTINDEGYQNELRKIKRAEFGKREALEKLTKGVTFNSRKHSRDHESQADSMAVELMKHTPFALSGSLTALALLDNIDKDTIDMSAYIRKELNSPGYPFKEKWIAKGSSLSMGLAALPKDSKLEDSLKTHPDCQTRIRTLEPVVLKDNVQRQLYITDREKFEALQQTCRYEIVAYAYQSENYTKSLYYTLVLLMKQPEDSYLITQVGKIMNGCYTARRAHTLGKMTDLPGPGHSAGYNVILRLIQNLYMEDYAAIGYHYLKQYSPLLSSDAAFREQFNKSESFIKQ